MSEILTPEHFEAAATEACSVSLEVGSAAVARIRAHDAALRRQVEELTRERDELRQQVDGVLSIVRHYAQDDGSDPVVGKVRRVMDCYQQALVALSVGAAALAERDALRARLAAMEMRDCTNAEMMALAEIIQREHHQNTSTVGTFWGPAARAAWRYVRDRLLEETAQGANAEPTAASSGAPRMPAPPVPTPPAAEASEVEALAKRTARQIARAVFGPHLYEDDENGAINGTWRAIGAAVLRREAALRERAEAAESEVARLREAIRLHAEETITDAAWGGSGTPLMPHDQRLWEAIGLDDPFDAARAKEEP